MSFTNTEGNEISQIDPSTETYALLNGTGTFNGREEIRETETFAGRENPLVAFRKYTIDFTCDFQLNDYPFDVQVQNAGTVKVYPFYMQVEAGTVK